MSNPQSKSIPFRVSSRMIRMFGRQNVSNPLVAIIELIKNAYDADAKTVSLTFSNAATSSGIITISDDGCGMDEEALTNRWMMIGTDYKEREPISAEGRVRTGAKGIGRFALDRLGDVGTLETFQANAQKGLRLYIDWTKYDNLDHSFESIDHELTSIPNAAGSHGTKITISGLHDRWTKDDYISLHDDLVFLIPPLDSYNINFSIKLQLDEYPELSGLVKPLAREEAEYELASSIDTKGLVRHVLRHRSGQEVVKEVPWSQINPQLKLFEVGPACGPIEAKILFYLNDPKQVKSFDYKQAELERYLRVFRGVRIYRDGFQIKPYGSKGNDWLELDSRKNAAGMGGVRGKIGAYRVNNRQIIGTVTVSRQTNSGLEDRTSREGLIENDAYFDLKRFLMNSISFIEIERQYYVARMDKQNDDKSLEETVDNIIAAVEKIQTAPIISDDTIPQKLQETSPLVSDNAGAEEQQISLKESMDHINESSYKGKNRIVNDKDLEVLAQNVNDLEAQIQEIQILRALATIGIALATFSHEIKSNVFLLLSEMIELKAIIPLTPQESRDEIQESLDMAATSVQNIKNWSDFVLERIKKSRRTESIINFVQLVTALFQSFESSLSHYSIVTDIQIDENIPPFKAFPIDYEAIFINFISNASKALEGRDNRHIRCSVTWYPIHNQLEIIFEDSGPGIDIQSLPHPHAGIQQIFEPFVSASHNDDRSNDGTGMGLAIVRRIIKDLHGTVKAEAHGELGGAKFTIRLPIRKVEIGNGDR